MCYRLPDITDFEIVINNFSNIVGLGVSFLKYIHIGPVSLFDVIVCILAVEIIGWLIEAAHNKN